MNASPESRPPAPLEGVRVIEAANYIAGPFGGMILADLGAEVIKVEPPRGDPYRRLGRQYGDAGLQFRAANQNKSSVPIDLKSEAGMQTFFELLDGADMLLTNWRPGVAESLGITPERIRRDHPDLIWVRVSGYGQTGPRADLPAYDNIIQARSGAALSGHDEPADVNNNVADKVSAMFAAQTATAALLQRTATGTGSVCDVAMVDAMAYFYGADISSGHRMGSGAVDTGVGDAAANSAFFPTAEGHLALAPVSGRQMRRALEAAGVGERFGEVMDADRSEVFAMFVAVIGPPLLQRAAQEWEAIFREADVPSSAVLDFGQHLDDEQIRHNGVYEEVPDPAIGGWKHARFPGLFDGEPATAERRAAPTLDDA